MDDLICSFLSGTSHHSLSFSWRQVLPASRAACGGLRLLSTVFPPQQRDAERTLWSSSPDVSWMSQAESKHQSIYSQWFWCISDAIVLFLCWSDLRATAETELSNSNLAPAWTNKQFNHNPQYNLAVNPQSKLFTADIRKCFVSRAFATHDLPFDERTLKTVVRTKLWKKYTYTFKKSIKHVSINQL